MSNENKKHPAEALEMAKTNLWAVERAESFFEHLDDTGRNYLIEKLQASLGTPQVAKPAAGAPRGKAKASEANGASPGSEVT